jgi:hypothetical protein
MARVTVPGVGSVDCELVLHLGFLRLSLLRFNQSAVTAVAYCPLPITVRSRGKVCPLVLRTGDAVEADRFAETMKL